MQIIIINSTKNENVGIVEMPKNASSLFQQIMVHRSISNTTGMRKKFMPLSTFLIHGENPINFPGKIDATRLPTLGFNKSSKFTLIVYLRDPYKRFVSALYEEVMHGEDELYVKGWKDFESEKNFLNKKLLEENFANLDFSKYNHTELQSSLVTLGLKYCNYDFFYNPESLDVIVEKYNICKAKNLRPVNAFVGNEKKAFYEKSMTRILEKNKDIIYKYLKPDYDLLDLIKTKWGFSYGRYK